MCPNVKVTFEGQRPKIRIKHLVWSITLSVLCLLNLFLVQTITFLTTEIFGDKLLLQSMKIYLEKNRKVL